HLDRHFFPNSHTIVLPNPTPEFGGVARKETSGPLKLLSLASLEEHKGLAWLLEVLRAVEAPFELTIAGNGSLNAHAKNLSVIDQRFKFFGSFSKDEEVELLSTSDGLIVSSLCYENSPTVIYEALSCGVPVVASNIGGITELIEEGENGYLFEPGNGSDLLKQLQKIEHKRKEWFDRQDEIRMAISKNAMTHYLDKLEKVMKSLDL
ncbi:MAG: glycosyltransferase, partial [Candidatus Uhrbacteria bacterium]